MVKVAISIFMCLSLTGLSTAKADEVWYTIQPNGVCQANGTPSGIIVMWNEMGFPYRTSDVADPATGSINQTTLEITDMSLRLAENYRRFTLYRGLGRCEAAISDAKQDLQHANRQVIDKYK